jgi:uncharacterized protein with NAD-binding domain and iron-sulfur cluster
VAASDKKRVVIVGGGPAALAAAFELTSGELADRHEVTMLQPGWRLGGKCASGRGRNGRIEEHGLHVWFGCYDNAFALMRRCYEELGRDAAHYAFTSVGNAFEGLSGAVLWQHDADDWSPHKLTFPRTPSRPEDAVGAIGGALRGLAGGLARYEAEAGITPAAAPFADDYHVEDAGVVGATEAAVRIFEHHVNQVTAGLGAPLTEFADLARLAQISESLAEQLDVLEPQLTATADGRFRRDSITLLLTVMRGILRDGLLVYGFDSINRYDFAAWLRRHGAQLEGNPTSWPTLVRAVYDGCFAFAGGDPAQPTIAAGRALQGFARCLFHYRGSVIARMRGGMGDTVIAPFYEVLVKRGVDVRFFHAVKALRTDTRDRSVRAIDVVRQVQLTAEYLPLHDVAFDDPERGERTVPSWRAQAPWHIIEGGERPDGDDLLEHAIDPFGGAPLTLRAGRDFDAVVLAVPPDVQREICQEVCAASPRYAAMLDSCVTVATQASQMWLDQPLADLGDEAYVDAFMSCYVEPLDTYSSMTHLLKAESWPAKLGITHLGYFCGVLSDADVARELALAQPVGSPRSSTGQAHAEAMQAAARKVVRTQQDGFRRDHLAMLWAGGTPPSEGPATGPKHPSSAAPHAERHYIRANLSPTERYVLTPPGTVERRLWPSDSGLDNLVLAGDWTRNGFEVGCVEAAMTSGMLAAHAICGSPALDGVIGLNGPPGFPNRPGGDGPPGSETAEGDPLVAAAEWATAPLRLALTASRASLGLVWGAARRSARTLVDSARR